MKIEVSSQAFKEALGITSGVTPTRTPKPALQCVLIKASKDSITLMTTDLEIGLRYHLTDVRVETEGEALVPAAKVTQIVRECEEDEVLSVHLKDQTFHIYGKGSHFQVFSADPQEFPPVPELDGPADIELTGAQLRRLSQRTVFAAAKESTRYAIDGVLWDRSGDQLRLVATDGRRLALASCTVEGKTTWEGQVIVPSKAMSLLGRIVTDPEERFAVKFLSNQILLKSSRVTVSSTLVEGHFPKYQDIIPTDGDRRACFRTEGMLRAVRRAALLTSEESRAVRFRFDEGKLVMTSRAPQQGEATVELDLSYEGEPLEIGFDPAYLTDMLKITESKELQWELKESNRPGVFKDGQEFLYVVMPVSLS